MKFRYCLRRWTALALALAGLKARGMGRGQARMPSAQRGAPKR